MPRGRPKRSATKTSRRTSASRPRSRKSRAVNNGLRDVLAAIGDVAKKAKLRWYVFGAQAVNLHGHLRATADIDVTIELGATAATSLVDALVRAGFDPRFADAAFITSARVIPLVHRASAMPVDVVLAGPGLEEQFLDEVVIGKVGGLQIPMLSIENLIITKLIAGRVKDLEDVRELVGRGTVDHTKVEAVLAMVEDALGQSDLRPLYGRLRG